MGGLEDTVSSSSNERPAVGALENVLRPEADQAKPSFAQKLQKILKYVPPIGNLIDNFKLMADKKTRKANILGVIENIGLYSAFGAVMYLFSWPAVGVAAMIGADYALCYWLEAKQIENYNKKKTWERKPNLELFLGWKNASKKDYRICQYQVFAYTAIAYTVMAVQHAKQLVPFPF